VSDSGLSDLGPHGPGPEPGPELQRWLGAVLTGQLVTGRARLGGGYRNRNTRLDLDDGESLVLRQYDADDAARICAIEAAVLARLRGAAPVPDVVAADPTGTAAGEPVLLTRFAAGMPLSAALADPQARPGDHAGLGRAAGQALAAIGTVSFPRGGFFTDGTLQPAAEDLPGDLPEFVNACLAAGPAPAVLSAAELDGLQALARADEPFAARADGGRQLVHSDFNPKNLLAVRADGRWSVSAVLDWEFAFSGSPLHDIGNMLRFEQPPGFAAGFADGFRDGGGDLPPDWRPVSAALDLFALADLLTRPAGHPYFGKAVSAVRARLAGAARPRPGPAA
jgi:aminoglycoside phosphotransferase (APT) family kinase protein